MTQPLPALASSQPPADRLRSNVERLFTLMLPFLAYLLKWEYTVVAATPGLTGVTVDAVPVDTTRCPFGPLTGIALWKGPSGSPCVPVIGSRVLVEFHDGNPAKPAVCGVDPSVPTIPPPGPAPIPGAPLSVAGALTSFATLMTAASTGPLAPMAAPAAALAAYMVELL